MLDIPGNAAVGALGQPSIKKCVGKKVDAGSAPLGPAIATFHAGEKNRI